jgi:hypothetical protein
MQIDESAWPLVVMTVLAAPEMATLEAMSVYFDRCFERREPYALVTDARLIQTMPGAIWRKRLLDWIDDPNFRDRNKRYNVGSATIFATAPVRAALTALHWLWRPSSPQYYAADLPDAVEWCVRQLEGARVPLTEGVRDLRASLVRTTCSR